MSYMDNGEDEVDYGEAEDHNMAYPLNGHAPAAFAEDDEEEMMQDQGYEDLYDDVDIVFGQSTEISKDKEAVDADEDLADKDVAPLPHQQVAKAENYASETLKKQEKPQEASGARTNDDDYSFATANESRGTQPSGSLIRDSKPSELVPGITISFNQAKSKEKEDSGMAVSQSSVGKSKNESLYEHAGSDNKPPIHMAPPPQERELKAVDYVAAVSEPVVAAVIANVNARSNHATLLNDNIGARKAADVSNDRNRVAANVDQGYTDDFRNSQATNRDFEEPSANDHLAKHGGNSNGNGGCTMLFVGELHWWTTDEELETALSEYGVLKNLKFYEERASGKSKGYCQVEFYDHSAALACKENMNGRKFHGRPCLVAFANPRTIVQMGTAQVDKAQAQLRAQQAQTQSRRMMNDNTGNARGNNSYQGGDSTRGYGRQAAGANRGGQSGTGRSNARGRTNIGNKGMNGNTGNMGGVAPYGQGIMGPMGSHPSGLLMPQAMMGQGYDPGYGPPRAGAGYGGYVLPGPPFTGMVQPFPNMGPGTLAGVAPHVNPAFFGRNATSSGMAGNGMDGSPAGLWGDGNMNGWGSDEHDRRGREASFGDDMGGSDYTYSNELAYERSRGAKESEKADAEWPERRRHKERESYKEQRRDRDADKDDDWDRERSGKSRNKGRSMMEEEEKENQRSRSRDEDYGKRRRTVSER